jgi:hypothetical protein
MQCSVVTLEPFSSKHNVMAGAEASPCLISSILFVLPHVGSDACLLVMAGPLHAWCLAVLVFQGVAGYLLQGTVLRKASWNCVVRDDTHKLALR